MAEANSGWNKTLVIMIWGVVCAFAALCVSGFFFLANKVDAETSVNSVAIIDNRERLVRLEECVVTIRENISEIKEDTKIMIKTLNKALDDDFK